MYKKIYVIIVDDVSNYNIAVVYWRYISFSDMLMLSLIRLISSVRTSLTWLFFVFFWRNEFDTFFIGYQTVNGSLKTLDGREQTWAAWETGQPNGAGPYVSSSFENGRFWDEKFTSSAKAICQRSGMIMYFFLDVFRIDQCFRIIRILIYSDTHLKL